MAQSTVRAQKGRVSRSIAALVVALLAGTCVGARSPSLVQAPTPAETKGTGQEQNRTSEVDGLPAEILSDTQGVNFSPYLHTVLRKIYEQWTPLMPDKARVPQKASGESVIRFTIFQDGTIGSMHLDASTKDVDLNRAAWGAVSGSGQFPPLPETFHGPSLELRIHFKVNE